ncbi:hypothetical protein [Novosphingobium aquae]|uniref:Uncharacterized protein n=1 Tax=Novosphingobium aquae TaxID=3133435 RepID=A0ABU8SC05_9SPHN
MKNTTQEKSKVLSLAEKRKLESLILQDIEEAERAFNRDASNQRAELIKRLEAKPPADVSEQFTNYQKSQKTASLAEEKMAELGWKPTGYGDTKLVIQTYGIIPKELVEFDEKVTNNQATLASYKRSFAIKLFANGVEASNLFTELAKEISKLVSK